MVRKRIAILVFWCSFSSLVCAQDQSPLLLRPAQVFDGLTATPHESWVVVVRGERIEAVGPASQVKVPANARSLDLSGATLLGGTPQARAEERVSDRCR